MSELQDPELRDVVRARRKARKQRQQDVAEAAGISLRAYQMFESGQSRPQRANLRAILRAVGMDEAQEDTRAELTWESWEPDIQRYLLWFGAYLDSLDEQARRDFMAGLALQIIQAGADSA